MAIKSGTNTTKWSSDVVSLGEKVKCALKTIVLQHFILLALWPLYVCVLIARQISEWLHLRISNLSERHVIISGCDSGFGQALALDLARRGVNVFAGCLTDEGRKRLKELSSSERIPNGTVFDNIKDFQLDVTSDASVEEATAFVQKNLPPNTGIWAIVNNAGIGEFLPDDWISLDAYKRTFEVNYFGAIRVVHAFKELIKRERGRIVFVGSALGFTGCPLLGPYVSSKFAINGYVETLRMELKCFGVNVIVVAPGFHRTAITDSDAHIARLRTQHASLSDSAKDQYPAVAYLQPKEVVLRETTAAISACNAVQNVTDALTNAVTAKCPRNEYWIGFDANFYFRLLRLLPSELTVWANQITKVLARDGVAVQPVSFDLIRNKPSLNNDSDKRK